MLHVTSALKFISIEKYPLLIHNNFCFNVKKNYGKIYNDKFSFNFTQIFKIFKKCKIIFNEIDTLFV